MYKICVPSKLIITWSYIMNYWIFNVTYNFWSQTYGNLWSYLSHPDIVPSTCLLQVIEVILPMLCNYLSYWWEKGPENWPPGTHCCTMVTSEHLSSILGNILKILNNNLGIDDAPWMKRIAGVRLKAVRERINMIWKSFQPVRFCVFIQTYKVRDCNKLFGVFRKYQSIFKLILHRNMH